MKMPRDRLIAGAGLLISTLAITAVALATVRVGQRRHAPSSARAGPRLTESQIPPPRQGGRSGGGRSKAHPDPAQRGTRAKASLIASGAGVPGNRASYLIAERGHFVANDAPMPPELACPPDRS